MKSRRITEEQYRRIREELNACQRYREKEMLEYINEECKYVGVDRVKLKSYRERVEEVIKLKVELESIYEEKEECQKE